MITYRFCETLTDSDAPAWEKLTHTELGESVHAKRKQGFQLAREALRLALRERGIEAPIEELKLNRFDSLVHFPDFTLSLSHTPKLGAAILGARNLYRSLGIDIEDKNRQVKEMIIERIAHPEDLGLRNLELWCLKEAAFKAAMNTGLFDKPIEFSSLRIQDQTWSHSPSNLTGEWRLEEYKDHLVALAWIKN